MSEGFRRSGDYSDMPRQMAWFIISIKEIGIPAVVIGALLYICFISQMKMTDALRDVAVAMAKLDSNGKAIIDNQQIILKDIRSIK